MERVNIAYSGHVVYKCQKDMVIAGTETLEHHGQMDRFSERDGNVKPVPHIMSNLEIWFTLTVLRLEQ